MFLVCVVNVFVSMCVSTCVCVLVCMCVCGSVCAHMSLSVYVCLCLYCVHVYVGGYV